MPKSKTPDSISEVSVKATWSLQGFKLALKSRIANALDRLGSEKVRSAGADLAHRNELQSEKSNLHLRLVRLANEEIFRIASENPLVALRLASDFEGGLAEINRHIIAEKFYVELTGVSKEKLDKEDSEADKKIDPDWINTFVHHAGLASTAEMQAMLALILKEEVLEPGSFSKSSLRKMAELDRSTAELFQLIVSRASINVDVTSARFARDRHFRQITVLEDSGLISGAYKQIERQVEKIDKYGNFEIQDRSHKLLGKQRPGKVVGLLPPAFGLFIVTAFGKEVARLLNAPTPGVFLQDIAGELLQDKTVYALALYRHVEGSNTWELDQVYREQED